MLQAAETAWQRKDFQECIETLQNASRLAPANAGILLRLGRITVCVMTMPPLKLALKKPCALRPAKSRCSWQSRINARIFATRTLRSVISGARWSSRTRSPQACIKLAELYERLRRLPEATQLVEQALTLNPAYPAALLVRARLERLAGRLEAAEQLLRSFITKPVPDVWIHAQAWYELATILDRQQKFDDAMTAFLNAKNVMRPQISEPPAEAKAVRDRMKVMESNVSAEMLKRWFDDGQAALLPARRAVPALWPSPFRHNFAGAGAGCPSETSFLPRKLKFFSTTPLPRSNALCRRTTICCPFWKRLIPPRCNKRARPISNPWNFPARPADRQPVVAG